MKSQYPHNLFHHNTQLYIITAPHKRVIVPKHRTRSAIPIIIPLEMCLSSE